MRTSALPSCEQRPRARVTLLVALVATAAALGCFVPSANAATLGIWLSPAEVRALPTSGKAWENVKATADANLSGLELMSHRASLHDTATLAVALVAVRTGDPKYRQKAAQEIDRAIGSENDPQPPGAGNWHNPIGRNTTSYVVAADLIDLQGYDAALDGRFRAWIRGLRDNSYYGEPPIRQIHEERSNNHGTMAGAARAAVSRYLGDTQELARTAQVLRGWMGDRQSHSFPLSNYHDGADTYMPDPSQPRPVNPVGSVVKGHNLDGWQPQEHARCGTFKWPPCYTIYPWGGLAGSVVAAEILYRAGYTDVYEWEDRALLRAYVAVHGLSLVNKVWWQEAVSGDDSWQPWLANYIYGTSFPTISPTRPGRNMGWTDWTHAGRRGILPTSGPGSGGAPGTAPCLPRRLRITGRRIGSARIGRSFQRFLRRYRVTRRTRHGARFCVRGGGRFAVTARKGRIVLVATTARGHRIGRIRPGRRLAGGRVPGSRRVVRGLLMRRPLGRGRVFYGTRRGRVRYVAVVTRDQARHPRKLARRLRGLR